MSASDTAGKSGAVSFFNNRRITVRTEVLAFQEDLRVIRYFPRQTARRKGGGLRNSIQSRSKASVRRLSFHLRNDPAELQYMITLTYPRQYPHDGRVAKKHLKALLAWLRRRGVGGYWILEFQYRGAVHFHLFVVPRVEVEELRAEWNHIIREYRPDGVTAQVHIRGMNQADMAVYAAKRNQAKVPDSFANVGRFWGRFNLPKYEPLTTIQGTEKETAPFIRTMRRAVNAKRRKRLRIDKGRNSFTLHGGGRIARYWLARNQGHERNKTGDSGETSRGVVTEAKSTPKHDFAPLNKRTLKHDFHPKQSQQKSTPKHQQGEAEKSPVNGDAFWVVGCCNESSSRGPPVV